MNKVFLIGNLTKDPEVTVTNSGITVCRLSIAVSRAYKNSEGEREVDFFNINVWRGLAENCGKFLRKGSKVAVTGSIHNRSYEAQDGTRRNVTEITAEDVEFLTPKTASDEGKSEIVSDLEPITDDGLPF